MVESVGIAIVAFFAGAIPFSYIAARHRAGVDLRAVGTGTVSGTSLYRVTGFGTLAVAGVADVAKGAVGPVLAGDHTGLAAVCAGLAVAGHNWSPFLRGAGGRGLSPAIGALLVISWPGTVLLLLGMVLGKFAHQTGLGVFVALVLLIPLLAYTAGSSGALAGVCIVVPMFTKRVLGNGPPPQRDLHAYVHRLGFDNDEAASVRFDEGLS
jgi:acyl phosphate:glycerol-3-phosphate acyltransferase